MIKKLAGEEWKQMQFPGWKELRKNYAVSNTGRCASYNNDVIEDGKLLNGSSTTGYRTLNVHRANQKSTIYLHREIAKLFCVKPSTRTKYVIHLNHIKTDNKSSNLQWASLEEMMVHQQNSPLKIAYKKQQKEQTAYRKGLKLTPSQVRIIKKLINNPKRTITYKQLAKKYNVSEMTLFRIKSGENWSRVNP
ncbi:MAG: NUMOD4 domain-containing protein [Lacibacter sp.]